MNRIITGYIYDTDGQPLPGAAVQAFSGQAPIGTDPGKVTDANGYFSLYIGEREKVRVSYVGMQPYEITLLPDQIELYVTMQPDATLPVATITADAPKPKKQIDWASIAFWLLFALLAYALYTTI